jgi:hypothetical protein
MVPVNGCGSWRDTPGRYEIRIGAHLGPEWSDWFADLQIENQPDGVALLSGTLPDQAALHGVLTRIRDMGLPLLLVTRTDISTEE